MNWIVRAVQAVYYFLVGDMRILIGTLAALAIIELLARVSPVWAGPLLFVMLAVTLVVSLRHELAP